MAVKKQEKLEVFMDDINYKKYFYTRLLKDKCYEIILQNIGLINEGCFLEFIINQNYGVPLTIKTEKIIEDCFDVNRSPNVANRVVLFLLYGKKYPLHEDESYVFCPTKKEFKEYILNNKTIFRYYDMFHEDAKKELQLVKELIVC